MNWLLRLLGYPAATTDADESTGQAMAAALQREFADQPQGDGMPYSYVEPGGAVDQASEALPESLSARNAIQRNRQRMATLDDELFGGNQ